MSREFDESKWRDLACRMVRQANCSISEVWKRKRPRCSAKTRVISLWKNYTYIPIKYVVLKESSWQSIVEKMCTGKAVVDWNLFTGIFTRREALDNVAVQLTLLGFDDLVKIAEERLSKRRRKRSNANTI